MPGPLGRHSELSIEYVPIRALQPSEKNSRLHPRKQIEKLARAIFDFGFLIPVLVDAENKLIAGHARVEAAEVCSLSAIPCVRTSHLSEAQKRAFAIVDNRLAKDSTWNFELLEHAVFIRKHILSF
jgi:ParB-like chromosome segregation protein Spo0J